MSNIGDIQYKLKENLSEQLDELKKISVEDEKFDGAVNGITKLMDRMIKIEDMRDQKDLKDEARLIEADMKIREIKELKAKNRLEVVKIVVPTTAMFLTAIGTAIYEKTDTVTNTPGKISIRNLMSFFGLK